MRKVKVLSVCVLLALLASATLAMGQGPTDGVPTEEEIGLVLLDYSTSLSTGQALNEAYYSPAMRELLQERRAFYAEFFATGLHSDLISIGSNFTIESIAKDEEHGNLYRVEAIETVTLQGRYRCSSPEEYPLVKSGRWALAGTDDDAIKTAVEGYIASMIDGITQSIQEGSFAEYLVIRHSLVANGTNLNLIEDSFTDASNDNPGSIDAVSWVGERWIRHWPNFKLMPDYEMYHTPVEELGQRLLDAYLEVSHKQLADRSVTGQFWYNRNAAAVYIRRWVKNTSLTCATDIYQNQSNWNPAYDPIECNDCANYVSEALKAGGHPTNSTWQPYTTAWVNVGALKNFIYDYLRGMPTLYLTNLRIGDLAFSGSSHVVMISLIGPHRYSAHTSDRKDKTGFGAFNEFVMICSQGDLCYY